VTGRQFDKDGNMMQWWNNVTIRAFRERAQCIIDQYSRYKLDEVDLYVNGRMTQGENIADNGGLKQSFRVSPSALEYKPIQRNFIFNFSNNHFNIILPCKPIYQA
jgi:predicted metalloendopeptidase